MYGRLDEQLLSKSLDVMQTGKDVYKKHPGGELSHMGPECIITGHNESDTAVGDVGLIYQQMDESDRATDRVLSMRK